MNPNAPAANPSTTNTNMPYGGFGQANSDVSLASNILNYLPTQEAASNRQDPSDTSILPSVSVNAPSFAAPTAPVVDPSQFGGNLDAYNKAVQNANQQLTGSENSTYQNAIDTYTNNMAQYGNLTPVYQNLANAYGLPGYQQDVATLQGLLQNLTQDVNQQTTLGGGLMTSAARDEMEANRQQPLQTALDSASREYQLGQTDVNNLLNAYQTSITNAFKPEELDISNLPTLFGQTNQLADSGYSQGATAIEDTIQNQQKQQEIGIQQATFNAQYGNGTMTDLLNKLSTGQIAGMELKNTGAGGSAGYEFSVNNAPASAGTWAATNSLPINYVLSTMASKGDKTAESALTDITNAGGVTQSIVNTYPSLFWNTQNNSNTSSNKSSNTVTVPQGPQPTNNPIANANLRDLSTPDWRNLWGML